MSWFVAQRNKVRDNLLSKIMPGRKETGASNILPVPGNPYLVPLGVGAGIVAVIFLVKKYG